MSTEFRSDGTPIEIDDSFKAVTHKGPVRVITNGKQAISILGPGKKRDRLLAEYLARQKPKPKIEAMVPEVKIAPAAVEVVEQFIDATPHAQIVQTDEEAEQEFLNAVPADVRERYKPLEDEWFLVRVVHRDWKSGKYLLLELSTGDIVYCPWQRVTRSPGNHSLCLPLQTECSVRMKLDRGKYWALEMQTEGDAPHGFSRAQITGWYGMAGNAYRECGCPIFIICPTTDWQIGSEIKVGDWVEIAYRPSDKRGWVGFIQRKISAPTAQEEKNT
jgi:hypothetical protein